MNFSLAITLSIKFLPMQPFPRLGSAQRSCFVKSPLCAVAVPSKGTQVQNGHCQALLPPHYLLSQCHFSYTANSAMISFCLSITSRREAWTTLLLTNMGRTQPRLVLIFWHGMLASTETPSGSLSQIYS